MLLAQLYALFVECPKLHSAIPWKNKIAKSVGIILCMDFYKKWRTLFIVIKLLKINILDGWVDGIIMAI